MSYFLHASKATNYQIIFFTVCPFFSFLNELLKKLCRIKTNLPPAHKPLPPPLWKDKRRAETCYRSLFEMQRARMEAEEQHCSGKNSAQSFQSNTTDLNTRGRLSLPIVKRLKCDMFTQLRGSGPTALLLLFFRAFPPSGLKVYSPTE